MKTVMRNSALLLAVSAVSAQTGVNPDITIPATDGSLPAPGSNGCAEGYFPSTDTVIFTVPYTYKEVLSIIGNYTNLTWSGSPDNSVTTNNSAALKSNDWTPGSARFYDIDGAHVIETITTYEKPADGPYIEIHTLAPLTIPAANLSAYSDYDAQNWTSICGGKATYANFTIHFCATNATLGAGLLHSIHLADAVTVGKFLGGNNFTTCEALESNSTTPSGSSTTSGMLPSSTSSMTPITNAAVGQSVGGIFGFVGAFAGFAALAAAL
ncbi:Hypothetical protein R9X50_00045900 [Acrodontium crateriforme]|uniref:Uncharacterized protein n=1 Tax=Acrodontium crateriforme TaxID=150365 RepID=A0AAQ3LYU3_9PEZI|nr:Hypothetical protein R9X50_00045900 [Acrodontium crateriforme]